MSLNRQERGKTQKNALAEIREVYGIETGAIVTMEEVVEHLYHQPYNGRVIIDDEMKEFVTNYRLNLYDCHDHDTFDEYHTGLRQLFEAVRYSNDKDQLKRIMEENREAYSNIDNDTREMLEVMAKVRISKENNKMENGEKRFNMCKAFEDYRLEGKIEGMQEYLVQSVCKKLLKNKPPVVIAEELEEELAEIEKIIEAQKRVGNFDAVQICRALAMQD